MSEIHHRLYGFELDKDFIVSMRNLLPALSCDQTICLDTDCLRCGWTLEGVYILPEMYEGFMATYQGNQSTSVVFGILLASSDTYNPETMKQVYGNADLPAEIEQEFLNKISTLPSVIRDSIINAGLQPGLIHVVEIDY